MTTFIKAVAEKGEEFQLIEGGYFGIPKAETALDRGLVELRKECVKLRAENKRLTAALEAISGTIAIYRAHQP
jgi:hypothetical protein